MLFFTLFRLTNAFGQLYKSCNSQCPLEWIGDGICDYFCMNLDCNFDSPHYLDSSYSSFLYSDCYTNCTCGEEKLKNGKCDPECNVIECGFDLGDCGYCAPGCFVDDLELETCKDECFDEYCRPYESNKCKNNCAPGCSIDNIWPDCNKECFDPDCIKYSYICEAYHCSLKCPILNIQNSICDPMCLNSDCNYDGGDCNCSKNCYDTSTECTTNAYITDPCDTKACAYKDGKCGYCASGCYKENLGDGTCQTQCNTESCNYDNGDCGCAPGCSYKYDVSYLTFIQIGSVDECSVDCLVLDCRFGIDFCSNENLVKLAVLNFLVFQDREIKVDKNICENSGCGSENIYYWLSGYGSCEESSQCNNKKCAYCMGKADKVFDNCVRQSFDECIVCYSRMVEGVCYDISDCPNGYEDIDKLTGLFGNSHWCLKEAFPYSTSNYKEIYVDSTTFTSGKGEREYPFASLYSALVNVYAAYTKIYLLNKEIDFFVDSSSIFVSDIYEPLNSNKLYSSNELWIIGSYSITEKTIVYWKDNLKITPQAQKFYLQNIEFVGKYTMNKYCFIETCYYCPYVDDLGGYYRDDSNQYIDEFTYKLFYSSSCSSYSQVNVFDIKKEIYIENVNFAEFRYQYNSFIKSSGIVNLKNVSFYKMQAKSTGSIILIDCTTNCIDSSFTYNQGLVVDIGAGYNDAKNVSTGSFFMCSQIGHISIVNVKFSFNFVFNNLRSSNKGFLIYSKNHLGTITIEDCVFLSNYANYLVYIDVGGLLYNDYRYKNGKSIAYSQQHFHMNNIEVISTYCSHGMIYYFMKNIVHNINIRNLLIDLSIVGGDGILSFVNQGSLQKSDVDGEYILQNNFIYVEIEPRFLKLENITIKNSYTGMHSLYIENSPFLSINNVTISNVADGDPEFIWLNIILLFKLNDFTRYISSLDLSNELPDLKCNEMVFISNSINLVIDFLTISSIKCKIENTPLGLSLNKISGITNITALQICDIEMGARLGIGLTIIDSNIINVTGLKIYNVQNMYESVIYIENCNKTKIYFANINNARSNYSPAFTVLKSKSFLLKNFLFSNMSRCLSLLAGIFGSSFTIESGNFTQCSSYNGKGGGVFLDSLSRVSPASLRITDVGILKSYSMEGSGIFISNSVAFNIKKDNILLRILMKENYCEGGGTISDYHFSGVITINALEMLNNNLGIYVFYANQNPIFQIYNSKIYGSDSLTSLFYLNSVVHGPSILIKNLEIFGAKKLALEAYNLNIVIDNMNVYNSFEGMFFNDQVNCNSKNLRISNCQSKAITIAKNCTFNCTNCEFKGNKNSIITSNTNSKFKFENSKIYSNNLNSGYIISISSEDYQESSLIDCQIYSNSLNSGSIIYLFLSALTLKNCSIIGNEGYSTKTQVIYSYNSILNIFHSKLQYNSLVENGAFLNAVAGSIVRVENSAFENSLSKIGSIYVSDANISIENCRFLGNVGGDIFTIQSYIKIKNSIFMNSKLTSSNSGVVGFRNNYKSDIEESVFKSISSMANLNGLAYIYDELSLELIISKSTLIGSNDSILGVFIKETSSIIIKNSNLSEFNTADYSALTAISNIKGCNLSIINSIIRENFSNKNGGGVYTDSFNLIIDGTEISFNSANDSGGGLYYVSTNCNDCGLYLLNDSKIFNNKCNGDGGAIKWKDYKPLIESSVLIYNNTAVYGKDFASIPAKFGLFQTRSLLDNLLTTLSNIPPGKKYADVIQLYIYDTYGQVVETENSIIVELSINETLDSTSAISGTTTFQAKNGVLNISDFILTGKPGSSAYLKLKSDNMISDNIRNDDTKYMDFVFIKVEFRNCTNGEQIQASACIDCIGGKYTLKPSENCFDCPAGASCIGGDTIIVKNGFWRSSLESDVIYVCEVFDACLKGNEKNELGNCNTGYFGVLCKSCEIGYSKTANGICTKCPEKNINFTITFFLCLAILFICFVMVKTTLTSAFSPKSLHSIYIKIFTNYLQLIFIVTQFDLEWPSYVTEFFNVQRTTASFSDQLFSLDCIIVLKSNEDLKNVYYLKLCMISALPIVIVALSYLFWIFYSFITERYSYLKREVYTTMIVLFFLAYPTIVKVMFSNFSCIEIDKMSSYLNVNTMIECWEKSHKNYSFIVVLPSIILWVIGIPTLLLILLTKNKKRLHKDYYRVVFGFLYNGYKQNRFYWEINIMYRKVLLITVTVFKISQTRAPQVLNFIIILLFSIYFHYYYKPYNTTLLNSMEMQALNIAAITIYFGLYYLSKSINEQIKIILFIFIVIGNSYFVINWLYYMSKALLDLFLKYFPGFKVKFNRGDAFDEEFYQEKIVHEGFYYSQVDGQKNFTFLNIKDSSYEEEFKYRRIEDAYIDVAKRDIERIEKSAD